MLLKKNYFKFYNFKLRQHRENSFQESTMPIYQFAAHPPDDLSCSLMLTLAPWTLFINSTACLVKLINFVDKNSCFVTANDIVMPFFISVKNFII